MLPMKNDEESILDELRAVLEIYKKYIPSYSETESKEEHWARFMAYIIWMQGYFQKMIPDDRKDNFHKMCNLFLQRTIDYTKET